MGATLSILSIVALPAPSNAMFAKGGTYWRRPRILIEGGLYHVYNLFTRGESVFSDPEEVIAFVELLRDVKQRDGMTILAWVVLWNTWQAHDVIEIVRSSGCLWRPLASRGGASGPGRWRRC